MNYYLKVLQNYANFEGRARRSEYWYFVLFNMIFGIAAGVLDSLWGMPVLYALYMLAIIVPSIAVAVRRLHDIGKSGWFLFVALIPLVGGIWLLILLVTDSNPGDNEFGSNPKEVMV